MKNYPKSHNLIQSDYVTIPIETYLKLYGDVMLQEYKFPEKKSSDGFYHMWIPDDSKKSGRRQLKASTLEILKNKVRAIELEKNKIEKKTFKECYEDINRKKLSRIKSESKLYSAKNTVRKSDYEYKRFFEGTKFEEKFIDEITRKDIEDIYEYNLARYDLKKKAADGMRVILSKVFQYAFSEYLVSENVYLRCNFTLFKDMIIEDVSISQRVYSDIDTFKILEYTRNFQKEKPKYIPAYALELQILIGARRGELPPLSWDDIFDDRIWIHKEQLNTKDGFVIVDHTKTHVERYFPITKDVREVIKKLKFVHDNFYPDSELLFPGTANTGAISNNVVYQFYKRSIHNLGIAETPGITKGTHSFRRNAITGTVNKSGGNIYMASKLYGNSPRTAEKNYYTGINLAEALEVLEK